MSSPTLAKLDRSINKINRFISTSIPLEKPFSEYRKATYPVRMTTERELLFLADKLTEPLFKDIDVQKATSYEAVIKEFEKLFSHREIILGEKKIVTQTLYNIKDRIKHLFNEEKEMVFTLLGYPNKMPNPLFTHSTSVDFAEILSFKKLYVLLEKLNNIYPYGVKLLILTENKIFYNMSQISFEEQAKYFEDLCYYEGIIDKKNYIEIKNITEYHTKELEDKWKQEIKEMKLAYENNEQEALEKINAVMPTNFSTLNYRSFQNDILLQYFDPEDITEEIEKLREKNYNLTIDESIYYLTYHQARYKLNFMDSTFPNTLRFTVAPKPGSFGINMLNSKSKLLPYYGYILVNKDDTFTIKYIIDIPDSATSVYLNKQLHFPFYYEI